MTSECEDQHVRRYMNHKTAPYIVSFGYSFSRVRIIVLVKAIWLILKKALEPLLIYLEVETLIQNLNRQAQQVTWKIQREALSREVFHQTLQIGMDRMTQKTP
jgi:hypothetical protein